MDNVLKDHLQKIASKYGEAGHAEYVENLNEMLIAITLLLMEAGSDSH